MAKSMLLVCRQSPWSGSGAREALDIALAGGAFDLPVALELARSGGTPTALHNNCSGKHAGSSENTS